MANIYGFGVIGIKTKCKKQQLKDAYKLLNARKLIEDNKEESFILSLSGKRVILPIKWGSGASLARFFQGLDYEGIDFDAKIENKIDWNKIIEVFPKDLKNKSLNNKIYESTKSKRYISDSYTQDVIKSLQSPPLISNNLQ